MFSDRILSQLARFCFSVGCGISAERLRTVNFMSVFPD